MSPFVLPAFVVLICAAPVAAQGESPANGEEVAFSGTFWELGGSPGAAEALFEQMSVQERVAQLFLVGWQGELPTQEALDWIQTRNLGGIKVFGWNGRSIANLTRSIEEFQTAALDTPHGIPLFTATDQEGGWVRHIRDTTSETPGNMAIGASGLPYDSYMSAYYIGKELRAVGINMNFAPTVDVYTNPDATVIGPRAFSDDPELTGLLGLAYYRGMEDNGIIATAKHYPGHGNADGDSHGMLPVINDDLDTLWDRELLPYRMMIPEGLPAILSGHLAFPTITGSDRPASISSFFKTTFLREELGFDGIVVTDDLYMGGALAFGATEGLSFAEICVEAIRAGTDLIMLSETPAVNGTIFRSVMGAYESDPDFRAIVDAAVVRILKMKYRYLYNSDRVPFAPRLDDVVDLVPDPEGAEYFREQAARSVTPIVFPDEPYTPEPGERILLAGRYRAFFTAAWERYPDAASFTFEGGSFYFSAESDRERLASVVEEYDTLVYCLSDINTAEVLASIGDPSTRIIVVSTLTPAYLADLPAADIAVAVYGRTVDSFRAGLSAVAGEFEPAGRLPFVLAGADDDS